MNALKKDALRRIVHGLCGKKGLNLSNEQRREIQQDVIGKASMTHMTAPELEDLIAHLRRLQQSITKPADAAPAKVPAPGNAWRFVFALPEDRKRLAQKLYRQAERIGAMQNPPVKIMSPQYMAGTARRMMGYDKPGFENVVVRLEMATADILHKMVQAMEKHMKRHGV
jgi:hypothetical protein